MEKIETQTGFYQFDIEEDEVVLDMLHVNEEHRGLGLGGKMLKQAIADMLEHAKAHGINRLSLVAIAQEGDFDGTALINFYKDYGFVSDGDCNELMYYKI